MSLIAAGLGSNVEYLVDRVTPKTGQSSGTLINFSAGRKLQQWQRFTALHVLRRG